MFRFIRSPKFDQLLGTMLAILGFLVVIFTHPIELNDGIGIGLIAIGVGFWVWGLTQMNERKIEGRIDSILERIENLQEEIKKAIKEKEDSRSPIVTSLQALSQYYLDFVAKQKREDEQQQEE